MVRSAAVVALPWVGGERTATEEGSSFPPRSESLARTGMETGDPTRVVAESSTAVGAIPGWPTRIVKVLASESLASFESVARIVTLAEVTPDGGVQENAPVVRDTAAPAGPPGSRE